MNIFLVPIVICPICSRNSQKSKVYEGESTSTNLPKIFYYDEEGNYKQDNPNITKTKMTCTNGHKFILQEQKNKENIYIEENQNE